MLTDRGFKKTTEKLDRFTNTLEERLFIKVGEAKSLGIYETTESLDSIPDLSQFSPCNERYGGEGVYSWFQYTYTVPENLKGKTLYLYPKSGFFEATLWVNGQIRSNFAAKHLVGSHGNHWVNPIRRNAKAGEELSLTLACYCYHYMPGNGPLENIAQEDYTYPVGPADIVIRDEQIHDFLFDLRTLLSLVRALPETSLRRASVENDLIAAHLCLLYDPDSCTEEEFRHALSEAAPLLKNALSKHNGDDVGYVGLIGHSHMDTAWQWPISETVNKCIRTYAGQLELMEDYPEYRFVQSSAYHADMLRRHAPELFARVQTAVREGRWEPNGGVWVECDCNLTGGEYMIRQFLWGQRFTRKYFDYTSDAFWLPDTFGYSFAIPQIMKGCDIDYFLTTKLSWNDTNVFPSTTFEWQGIDGTRVLTHFNRTHQGPTAEKLIEFTEGNDGIYEKRTSPMRLFSFGKGDGGGGPEFEMLEEARRLTDLAGVPRSGYTSVSEFMKQLEKTCVDPTVYSGELYLELHRGTLTNQSEIKRGNRLLEIALHNLEAALVASALQKNIAPDETMVAPLMNTLLVHQFHDILPGTCIASVHEETRRSVSAAITEANKLTAETLAGNADGLSLFNPTGFTRKDTLLLDGDHANLEGCRTQVFTDLTGQTKTAVSGLTLAPYSVTPLSSGTPETNVNPFTVDNRKVTTPFFEATFDEHGAIASLIDRRNGRELVLGLPFNTYVVAEDMPGYWDNWDIDTDLEDKFRPAGELLEFTLVSSGAAELRFREKIRLTEKTSVLCDIVFDATSPLITFDVLMDYEDNHRFIKAAFDTSLHVDSVRSEIQFGCIRRSNHRSDSVEKARFEVCNHKYSDLSETGYGITLVNDCKYGISAKEGSLRLSLHKGGTRPDHTGDHGSHRMRYGLLVHDGPYNATNTILPAYTFNYAPVAVSGAVEIPSLVSVDQPNIVIETIKPCEDTERAWILRLYEAEGTWTKCNLSFGITPASIYLCNMLEEEQEELNPNDAIALSPFAIRTLKIKF